MLRAHRTAAVLSIGDELALGQTLDTNSAWIADQLFLAGVRTAEHATVDDDEPRTAQALERLAAAHDLVVVTGGLGPTADDLTRFALARVLSGGPDAPRGEMVEDEAALAVIRAWFARRPGGMPAANAVQALRPVAAACLPNPFGTAPGLFARVERLGCDVLCLPGPPREMQPMFAAEVLPRVRRDAGLRIAARLILTFGLGESLAAQRLGPLMDRDRAERGLPLVGTTASRGVVTCRLRHEAATDDLLRAALDDTEAQVNAALGPAVVARRDLAAGDEGDVTNALPETVVGLLRARGERLAVVESCTGGLLGEIVTAVAGSSHAFAGGWITYSNEMKSALVGVDPAVFAAGGPGAVSAECAAAMARGGLTRAAAGDAPGQPQTAHALAITGIAGPGGGSDEKPVGTVFIALASTGHETEVRRFLFRGGRDAIRDWSARTALGMLRLRLRGLTMPLLGEVAGATPTASR